MSPDNMTELGAKNTKTYTVHLESTMHRSFYCQRAADSLDIDVEKKSVHELAVDADLTTPYHVGLIVGASGSGKSTLAESIFGANAITSRLDPARPVVDQFPSSWSYDERASALSGVGLTSVPCWIRSAHTLSTGQRARAEAALQMAHAQEHGGVVIIDEWTSVVDRTVAKVMSHCVQKHARHTNSRVILCSCHYDVIEWLCPDWIVDCNRAEYVDRRYLRGRSVERDPLAFSVRAVDKGTWRFFSKYHYLSSKLPGGRLLTFGLFHGADQVGFCCYANYTPHRDEYKARGDRMILHFNRVVVHPDYAGLGLGIRMVNATAAHVEALGYRVMGKFSSEPMFRSMRKDDKWRLVEVKRQIGRMVIGPRMDRKSGFRENVKTYSFEYIGASSALDATSSSTSTSRQPVEKALS